MRIRLPLDSATTTNADAGLLYNFASGVASRATSAQAIGVFVSAATLGAAEPQIGSTGTRQVAVLCVFGQCDVIAGGSISIGDFFTSDSDGKAVAATTGQVLGRAMGAGEAGDKVSVIVSPTILG